MATTRIGIKSGLARHLRRHPTWQCAAFSRLVRRNGGPRPRVRVNEDEEDEEMDVEVAQPSSVMRGMREAFTFLPQIETLSKCGMTERVEMPDEMLMRVTTLLKTRSHAQLQKQHELDLAAAKKNDRKIPLDMHKHPLGWTMDRNEQIAPKMYGPTETMSYLAYQLDAAYACTVHALRQLQEREEAFAPTSMLDFGAGPGTSSWAARECFRDSLTKYRVLEPSQAMVDAAEVVLQGFPGLSIRRRLAEMRADVLAGASFDLIVASFVLSEIPSDFERVACISALWELLSDGGMLVVVDHGSTWGSHQVRSARQFLLDSVDSEGNNGAHIVAPCPHALTCPARRGDWCHFVQRSPRIRYPRDATSKRWHGQTPSKFSYVCIQKQGDTAADSTVPSSLARLVRGPLIGGKHVQLDLCMPNGTLERRTVTKGKAMSEVYRAARKAHWGAFWPANESIYAEDK